MHTPFEQAIELSRGGRIQQWTGKVIVQTPRRIGVTQNLMNSIKSCYYTESKAKVELNY